MLSLSFITGNETMGRPKIHETGADRRAAHLADKDRFDFITTKLMGESIRELAAAYECSNSEVLNDLVRYALTNRNWKTQGLLWHRAKD